MKKLVSILAVLFITVSAMAQITSATGKVETIKSFRMGTCKLQKSTKDGGGNVSVSNVEFQRIKL